MGEGVLTAMRRRAIVRFLLRDRGLLDPTGSGSAVRPSLPAASTIRGPRA
ncbi:MAG: hypothetical protein ACRDOK_03240 [Streptosporangiaceae bacterium]